MIIKLPRSCNIQEMEPRGKVLVMKIISYKSKFLCDPNNSGLTEGWSTRREDAAPITEKQAAKYLRTMKLLIPQAVILVEDATPECVGRPISATRMDDIRSRFGC